MSAGEKWVLFMFIVAIVAYVLGIDLAPGTEPCMDVAAAYTCY